MDQKRIFLACQIPQEARSAIGKICQELKELGFALRLTSTENLHLTLAFLPRVNTQTLPKVSAITKDACRNFSPFSLFLSGLGAFPNLKLPKVVYVSLAGETGDLANLAKKIQKELHDLGFNFDEELVPHITIARIKSYVNKAERKKLGEIIQRWGKINPFEIVVDGVSIFESTPTSAGHVHTLLEKISLV